MEAQRPTAARQDAETALPAKLKAYNAHRERLHTAYDALLSAWQVLNTAVEQCERAQSETAEIHELRDEIITAAITHALDLPELSPLPTFPSGLTVVDWANLGHLRTAEERLRRCTAWKPSAGRWAKARDIAEQQREIDRQRQQLQRAA